MYQIQYKYNHGTWVESRVSNWLKDEEEVIKQLNIIKSYNAINIYIVQLVNVTKKFKI